MTNLDIRSHAAALAAQCLRHSDLLEPDEAWHRWSAKYRVTGAGARCLFEAEYASRLASLTRASGVSTRNGAAFDGPNDLSH
jgi:hypothetical protein